MRRDPSYIHVLVIFAIAVLAFVLPPAGLAGAITFMFAAVFRRDRSEALMYARMVGVCVLSTAALVAAFSGGDALRVYLDLFAFLGLMAIAIGAAVRGFKRMRQPQH